MASKSVPETNSESLYFNARTTKGETVLCEITVNQSPSKSITCKTERQEIAALFIQAVNFLLTTE